MKWRSGLVVAAALVGVNAQAAWAARLQVQFPPNQYRTSSATMMVIGSADAGVLVAGQSVAQSRSGHFAARIPLAMGANQVVVESGGLRRVLTVLRQAAGTTLPAGALIAASSFRPAGPVTLTQGQWLPLQVEGLPGLRVWAEIGGQKVELKALGSFAEAPPSQAVLTGALEAPQAALVTYAGRVQLPLGTAQAGLRLEIHQGAKVERMQVGGRLQVLPSEHRSLGEVVVEGGVLRSGPSSNHSRRYPLPKGAWVEVLSLQGEWAQLVGGSWMPANALKITPMGDLPPAVVRAVSLKATQEGWRDLRITLTHPVGPRVESSAKGLSLHLDQVQPELDLIGATPDRVVRGLSWQAEGDRGARFDLDLGREGGWGHRLRVEAGAVVLSLKAPPLLHGQGGPLGGARILLDPGHGGGEDPGCADPVGMREADRSLPVALHLAQRLRERGAEVRLTRQDDRYVPLVDRAAAVESWGPDLSLSLHWNALPDNGDPANTRGIGAFWYHPQAQALAQDLHRSLTTRHARPSYGVFWDNLALTRPAAAPSVLLEMGFLTNPEEAEWAADPEAMKRLAGAIAEALESHLLSQHQAALWPR